MHRFVNEYCTDSSFRDGKVHGYRNKTFHALSIDLRQHEFSHGNHLEMFADAAFYHLVAVLMKFLQNCALGCKVKTCLLHYSTGGGDQV